MYEIHKYEIAIGKTTFLLLPDKAAILSFQCQRDIPRIWVLVDTEAVRPLPRKFTLIGTGQPITPETLSQLMYFGTAQTLSGKFVWHLFEIKERG